MDIVEEGLEGRDSTEVGVVGNCLGRFVEENYCGSESGGDVEVVGGRKLAVEEGLIEDATNKGNRRRNAKEQQKTYQNYRAYHSACRSTTIFEWVPRFECIQIGAR